jgi:hypothetical protein
MLLEMDSIKEHYLGEVKKRWLTASDQFPDFLPEITEEIKEENKDYIEKVFGDFEKQVKRYSRLPFRRKIWRNGMLGLINGILFQETVIGIHSALNPEELDAFQEELKEFMRHARRFAPELTLDEIGQALRNYIVYAMFKVIHGVKTGFSMAGFGYSMLYPFTDNYIDSKAFSSEEKAEYNKIILDKIVAGRSIQEQNIREKPANCFKPLNRNIPEAPVPPLSCCFS